MAVYLITGASGYIGSMLTDHLLENEPDCEVIAPVRDIQKAGERFADIWGMHGRDGFQRKRMVPREKKSGV